LSAQDVRDMSALSARHLDGDVGAREGDVARGGVCSRDPSSIIARNWSALVGVTGTESGKEISMKEEKEGVGDGDRGSDGSTIVGEGERLTGDRPGDGMQICGGDLG